MNKELIQKLIEHARMASDNAFCPTTGVPEGCSLLVEGNVIFGGCNIESSNPLCSITAGAVAISKAISEGLTKMMAICFYSDTVMPYPNGALLDLIAEFNYGIDIIVASQKDYSIHKLHELLPIRRIHSEEA
ncbi:MAG: cytidine deaminase [Firmicutes bacterium]|nr:cytidine deaminase [Bacillota bacterium]